MHIKILFHCAVNTDSPLSSNHSWQPDIATCLNTRTSENQKFGSTSYTENYPLAGTQPNMMQCLENLPKAISFILPHSWKKIQMVVTAILIYSHGHSNQMGMEWWVNDTVGKTNVLGEIRRNVTHPTQFPHGLPLDLNPGHCGEEPETKPLSHGKCLKSFYYY